MKLNTSKLTILLASAFILSLLTITRVQAAPGDLDLSFGNGGKVVIPGNTLPLRVRVQSDGKIVALGDYPYASYAFISRNNSDGTPDSSFGSNGLVFLRQFDDEDEFFNDFITLPDGKYLIVGSKNGRYALFRYNLNGTRDTSFGTDGVLSNSLSGQAIAVQSDGKVINGGSNVINGVLQGFLVRYNTDGIIDVDFGENGMVLTNGGSDKIVIQPDGKFLVRSQGAFITRYNSNGTRDNNFGRNGVVNPGVNAGIGFQSNGKIIFGGGVSQNLSRIERYNENGTLDTTFGTNGRVDITDTSNLGVVRSLAVQRNNKILTAGSVNGIFAVYRFTSNGSLDATFGTNGLVTTQMTPTCRLWDITLQPDGNIVAVGDVAYAFVTDGLVRYLGDPVQAESGLTVTRSDDRNNAACVPGDCSLREAVNAANASPTDDTINFAPGVTRITLANEIVINNAGALALNGPGANVLTIDGGAGTNRIFYTDQAIVTVSGITLTGGGGTGLSSSGSGGAIFAQGGALTLDGVYVTGNRASGSGGGAHFSDGTHRIINSTFSANEAGCGGGFSNYRNTLTAVNTTVASNAAAFGGGICGDLSNVTLRNVTITTNTANTWGGGFFQNDDDGELNFGNTIVAGNNCITVAGNNCPTGGPEIHFSDDLGFIITSAGGNLVGDSPGDSTNTNGIIHYQPTDIRDTNPMLGALQNNGGSTPTYALLAGSPAIDNGLNPLISPLALAFDQRGTGFARIRDGNGDGTSTVDIGAFEVQTVSVSGKVTTPDGRGLRNASVSITDSLGVRRTVTTSSFGNYSFDDIRSGKTYVIAVSSKRYRYTSQQILVNNTLTDMIFVGIE